MGLTSPQSELTNLPLVVMSTVEELLVPRALLVMVMCVVLVMCSASLAWNCVWPCADPIWPVQLVSKEAPVAVCTRLL